MRRTASARVWSRRSSGQTACSTTLSPRAWSPLLEVYRSWKPMTQTNLSWVGLHIHADLLWHLDAVWLLNQSERRWLKIPIPVFSTYDRRPWHKDGLHPALLPGLEVALLGGDVLHQLPSLVAAHLASKFFSWNGRKRGHSFSYRSKTHHPREVEVSKI